MINAPSTLGGSFFDVHLPNVEIERLATLRSMFVESWLRIRGPNLDVSEVGFLGETRNASCIRGTEHATVL